MVLFLLEIYYPRLTSTTEQFFPDLSVLEDKAISHSLSDFSFTKDGKTFDDTTMFLDNTPHHVDDDDENEGFGMNLDSGDAQPVEDFFVGADGVENDYGGDMGGDDYGGDNHSNNGSVGPAGDGEPGRPGPFVPFDPRRLPNERDLVLAMADDDGEGGALDYFDQNFHKNWAGPEHWKLKKVIRKREYQFI